MIWRAEDRSWKRTALEYIMYCSAHVKSNIVLSSVRDGALNGDRYHCDMNEYAALGCGEQKKRK